MNVLKYENNTNQNYYINSPSIRCDLETAVSIIQIDCFVHNCIGFSIMRIGETRRTNVVR